MNVVTVARFLPVIFNQLFHILVVTENEDVLLNAVRYGSVNPSKDICSNLIYLSVKRTSKISGSYKIKVRCHISEKVAQTVAQASEILFNFAERKARPNENLYDYLYFEKLVPAFFPGILFSSFQQNAVTVATLEISCLVFSKKVRYVLGIFASTVQKSRIV